MQAVGGCHIDAAIEQPVYKARIEVRVHILAVVPVIVNGTALREVDLEHGSEALHDGFYLASAKYSPEAGNSGVADSVELAINVFGGEQIQVGCNHFHSQAMSIKRAIVQDHVFAPAHAFQDGTRYRHGSHGNPAPRALPKVLRSGCTP